MELSPVSENSGFKIDLCTPTENLNKQCQEITPDNPTKPDIKPVLAAKKVSAVGLSQKLSKRKLFWQPVEHAQGSENVSENTHKRKRTDGVVKNVSNDNTISGDYPTVKRLLTERQQLAFLLEATSTRENLDHAENDSASTFTKIKSRKRIKRNGKCVNSRVCRRNERGETPLHLAAIKGDVVGLRKLLKDGAEVSVKDYAGWTALHEASNHGNLAAAKLLVKHGAPVNVPGFEGDTPLHDAVVNNHVEVVNMLLSCGANPHQTNTRRKKPTELIGSKDMSDVFNQRGIKHAFQKKDADIGHEELASGNVDKTSSDNEGCVKSSILGCEIQLTETQGESKMEKPVMYICEVRNEELTMRTTQVTSYEKCSNVEDGVSKTKDVTTKVVGCTEPSDGRDAPKKEVSDKDEDEVKSFTKVESGAPHHEVEGVVLNDATSLQTESRDQAKVDGNTNTGLSVLSLASEGLTTGDNETDILGNVSINDKDEVNENTIKVNLPESFHGSEELTSVRSLEAGISEMKQENENTKAQPPLLTSADLPEGLQEKTFPETEHHVGRSRTPEIDESIAVEVLSGLLYGAPQLYSTSSVGQPGDTKNTPDVKMTLRQDIMHQETSDQTSYGTTSGGQQGDTKNTTHGDVSTPDVKLTLRQDIIDQETSDQTSVLGTKSTVRDDLMELEASDQSSVSNDEPFLDVEGLDADLKENLLESVKHGKILEENPSPSRRVQVLSPVEQEHLISSTSNYVDDPEQVLSRGDNAKAHVVDYPNSMIVSIPVNEDSGFPTVADSGHCRKLSSACVNSQKSSSNSDGNQPDTLGTSTLDDQSGSRFATESIALNIEKSEKTTILNQSSRLDNNDLTPWRFGNTLESRGTTICGNNEFRSLHIEKKALDKRESKKVGLRNATFTRDDGVVTKATKGKTVTMRQPISSVNQTNRTWEMSARTRIGEVTQQRELHTSRLPLGSALVKPSKPAVTWQSLMTAAGRCRLGELRIPGYDEFLMNTKKYELATDANQRRNAEEPDDATLTEEKRLSIKHEKSKEELLTKQKSEQDKLQLCLEQEMVRFYAKRAYSSLKCNQPPGVCSAIYWQNMSQNQLLNEKEKLSQKLYLENDQTSPTGHQVIIEKYEKLKSTMAKRHKHEQQSLDAVIKRELQSYV